MVILLSYRNIARFKNFKFLVNLANAHSFTKRSEPNWFLREIRRDRPTLASITPNTSINRATLTGIIIWEKEIIKVTKDISKTNSSLNRVKISWVRKKKLPAQVKKIKKINKYIRDINESEEVFCLYSTRLK